MVCFLAGISPTRFPSDSWPKQSRDPEAGRRTALGGTWARTGLPQPVSSATYNPANELTQWGATTLSYDANGNLLSDGTDTYTWNARNQLASISGANTATFQYDALGRRARKTINGATTEFVYDVFNPVQEKDGPAVIANLLGGLALDEYFTRTDIAWQQNFLPDGLGSTLALADAAGAVATQYTYEPFGRTTVSGAATTNSFQYTGRENDGTGLHYYRARYYSASISRFISQDPIGFVGGINSYAYAGNSPVDFSDPFGLKPQDTYPGLRPSEPADSCPFWFCGFGPVGGGTAGAGGVGFGASATGSIGLGAFFGHRGASLGAFGEFGASARAGQWEASFPSRLAGSPPSLAGGAAASGSLGGFLTNATSSQQLGGPFDTALFNAGVVEIQYSSAGEIWVLQVTGGPGAGVLFSSLPTNTWPFF